MAIPSAPDLSTDDYVVVGLATCYIKDDGEVKELTVIEPVPSAYLETVFKGIPTSYKTLHATTLGALISEGNPVLPAIATEGTQICNDFVSRAFAAARTYKSRSSSIELLPLGTTRSDINYSTAKKRVLNLESVVTAEDNVKQHEYTHKVL